MKSECEKNKEKITDFVSGILPDSEAEILQQHLNECKDCSEYANALKDEDKLLTEYFAQIDSETHTRQEKILKAINNHKQKGTLSRLEFVPLIKLAVAASIIIVIIFGFEKFGNSSIAWADVVEKFQSVSFFNATFYLKGNTSAEPVQIDIWMGRGGKARIKVKEQVLFAKNGKLISGFNYVTREKIDSDQFDNQARSVIDMPGQSDSFSLNTVVQGMSNGVLKEITPMINPKAVISEDIVVFDLTSDLYPQWLRIWALRESKLPIRILAWNPENGQSVDVVLTYTKEQSESFFDPEEYEKALANSQSLLGDSQTNFAYALYIEPGGRKYVPNDLYKKYRNVEELRKLKEHLSKEELVEYYKAHPLEEGQMDFRKGLEASGYTFGSIKGLEDYEYWRVGTTVDQFSRFYHFPSSGRMRFEGDFNDVFLQYDIVGRGDIPNQKYVEAVLSRVGIEIIESEDVCTVWIAEYNGQQLKPFTAIKIPYPDAPTGTPGSLSYSGLPVKIKYLLNNLARQQDIVIEDKTGINEETELTWDIPNFKTQVGADLAKVWFEENFGITFKTVQRRMPVWVVRKKAP
ncbi:MAG: zf-HC2 domain-containing protein [Sedimentisphaerales bacterium]